jgi:magnesium-transporting ATPase (P-type)
MERRLRELVLCAGLCNMATIHHDSKADTWQANGDATEIALQVFAHKLAHGKPNLTRMKKTNELTRINSKNSAVRASLNDGHFELVIEHPFDSTIKRMSTAYHLVGSSTFPADVTYVFLKGAVERVLDSCAYVSLAEQQVPLTEDLKADIIARMDMLAAEGLRVLCLSGKKLEVSPEKVKALPRDELESDMCFLGLAGI